MDIKQALKEFFAKLHGKQPAGDNIYEVIKDAANDAPNINEMVSNIRISYNEEESKYYMYKKNANGVFIATHTGALNESGQMIWTAVSA